MRTLDDLRRKANLGGPAGFGRGLDKECTSDLVVRERRGLLSSAELLALDAHVDVCGACRVARQLGLDFDRYAVPEIDDGDRVQRLMTTARNWYGGRNPVRGLRVRSRVRRRTIMLFAACFVLVGGVAAAAFGLRQRAPAPVSANDASANALSAAAAPKHAHGSTNAAAAPANDPVASEVTVAAPIPAVAQAAVVPMRAPESFSHRPQPRLAPTVDSAKAMFRAASDARREGDVAGAKILYRTLQHTYPDSPEAAMSYVPLGGLLLDAGDAKGAVDQFERCLQNPRAALKAEALYGEGRALAALGDHSAERRVWTRMLDEFATCPYATTARRRLAQLQ